MLYMILRPISHYIFLLMTYYLLFLLHTFWTMEMILDKKQIQVIFLFKSAWLIKQWRQLATSTTHLAPELPMDVQ